MYLSVYTFFFKYFSANKINSLIHLDIVYYYYLIFFKKVHGHIIDMSFNTMSDLVLFGFHDYKLLCKTSELIYIF